jgi:hypothetical protein
VIIRWRAWVVKCLCECYMKLADNYIKRSSKENVYVNVTWSLGDNYIKRSSKENVYVNVTWSLADN